MSARRPKLAIAKLENALRLFYIDIIMNIEYPDIALCDYQILEFLNYEPAAYGTPFIVVLRIHMEDLHILNGYVLQDWATRVHAVSETELREVKAFLDNLRYHCRIPNSSGSSYFDQLKVLTYGRIRTYVDGSCHFDNLDTLLPMFFDGEIATAWQSSFNNIDDSFLN